MFSMSFLINIKKTGDKSSIINEKGCLSAGEEWLENNLLVVAGVAVGIAFLQVCLELLSFNYLCIIFFGIESWKQEVQFCWVDKVVFYITTF